MEASLLLDKLDPTTLRDSCLIGLVAQKGCGKTTALKHLLYIKRHIPAGACFSGSGDSNSEYDGIFPKMFLYGSADLAKIEEIYNYQTTKTANYKRRFTRAEKREMRAKGIKIQQLPKEQRYVKDPTIVLLLEDLLSDKKMFNKKIVRDLAMNGRHQNIFAVMTIQYFKDVPLPIRQNIDYWFVFKEDNKDVRHSLFDAFGTTHMKTFDVFCEVMDVATADNKVLFIDARESSRDVRKKFKWWRADPDIPDFRLGCERFWQYDRKNYKAPDTDNKVIVNKYAARMACNVERITESERREADERFAMAAQSTYNKKRKRGKAAQEQPAEKKPRVVLLDEPEDDQQQMYAFEDEDLQGHESIDLQSE